MFEPLECPYLPQLEAFWDGELTGEPEEALFRHLDDCAPCAAAHHAQERLARLLRAEDPADLLSAGAVQRIRGELLQRAADSMMAESPQELVLPRGRRSRFRLFFALGPALAAAVWIAYWNGPWQPRRPAPTVVATPASPQKPAVPHQETQVEPSLTSHRIRSNARKRLVHSAVPQPRLEDTDLAPTGKRVRVAEVRQRPTPTQPPLRQVDKAPGLTPKAERLVIDVSGAAGPARPEVASLTLVVSSAPDSPDGELAVIQVEGPEETP